MFIEKCETLDDMMGPDLWFCVHYECPAKHDPSLLFTIEYDVPKDSAWMYCELCAAVGRANRPCSITLVHPAMEPHAWI